MTGKRGMGKGKWEYRSGKSGMGRGEWWEEGNGKRGVGT